MRRWIGPILFTCAFLTPLASTLADQTDDGLEALMTNLREVKSASAHFVEHKTVHLLTRPLETSGTLRYTAPDTLEKVTTAPFRESIILNGETLSGAQKNGDNYSVTLSDHPEVATLVEGVRATLAGDLTTLRQYYTVAFTGNREGWQLDLTPKNRLIRDKVDRIHIEGSEAILKTIAIHEKDGDHSEMIVTPDSP